jgi:phosphonate transport system ATP-binding protein
MIRDTMRATDITLNRVSAWRGSHEVLKDLSLTIAAGSVTVIVGPSGVGKTTLIGLLNGLIRPVSGSVEIATLGTLADAQVLHRYRRRTATVFQEHALIDRLTALENVLLGLADGRLPLSPLPWPRAFQEQAAQALAAVSLLHRAAARTGSLSGGERQRVGIARALVRRPSLLLGDEPFSAVDPALTRQLSEEFRSLVTSAGITVVLVLHQMEIARRVADRIIGLRDGRIAFDGPPAAFDAVAQAALFPMPRARPGEPFPQPCQ